MMEKQQPEKEQKRVVKPLKFSRTLEHLDLRSAPEAEEKQPEKEPEEAASPWQKLLKKRALTPEQLEDKILQSAQPQPRKFRSDAVKAKKASRPLGPSANCTQLDLPEEEQPKPRLKGAEQFDRAHYSQKPGLKHEQPVLKAKKQRNSKKQQGFDNQQERLGFFARNREQINRLGMTAAVLIIVISAYVGINQVRQTGEQDAVLTVSDTVPQENGENKVEVLEEQSKQQPAPENGSQQAASNQGVTDAQPPTGGASQATPSVNSDNDYFVNYRLEREKIRSQQLDLLNDLVEEEGTLPEVRKEAQEKVLAITQGIEQELLLESLLVAKYGGEAVVFVQPDKVNVVLRKNNEKMSDNEAEKIAQLVDTYTDIGFENAIIVIKD